MNDERLTKRMTSSDSIALGFEETEGKSFTFKGEVFDTIHYPDGRIEKKEKSFNIVVDSISKLISALIKSQSGYNGGKLYWALGSGSESWDTQTYTPNSGATRLVNEVFRKEIPMANRSFIDDNGNKTNNVTNKLQLDIVIESTEAVGFSLREFGIFGGNATETRNSGIMINHKTHSRIDKVEGMKIERSVRFTF